VFTITKKFLALTLILVLTSGFMAVAAEVDLGFSQDM